MTELVAKGLSLDNRVRAVDFTLKPGELVAIVGPNGSGKTSLLRLLSGLQKPDHGTIQHGHRPIDTLTPQQRARALAYLPQRIEVAWPIRVAEMVALGRFAYGPSLTSDREISGVVAAALADLDASHLAQRSTAELSGGELALCALARIFVANTPLLLLDEPVAPLDPSRQSSVMALLRQKVGEGCGIAVVMHDLNLAAQIADRIVWMKEGQIVAQTGASKTELKQQIIDVFAVEPIILTDEVGRVTALAIAGLNDN